MNINKNTRINKLDKVTQLKIISILHQQGMFEEDIEVALTERICDLVEYNIEEVLV